MRKERVEISEMRPPLLGFDPVVAGLHQLTNQVISMRMEQGNPKIKHLPGPVFPTEVVDERMRKYAASKRAAAIEAAQSKPKYSRQVSGA